MEYNLIKKIKEGEFSLREDWEQTVKDFDTFYKKIGLEKLVKSSEKILGPLDERIRRQVGFGYASGTAIELMALYNLIKDRPSDATYYATMGGLLYILSVLHHSKMSKQYRQNLISERGTLN